MFKRYSTNTPPLLAFRRRGQTTVLFALLIPIFLFLGGVGLDLGWYYLNVSRLQSAADASVLVGARSLLNELKNDEATKSKFAKYKVTLVDKYPADKPHTSTVITAEMLQNANEDALNYAKKNLEDSSIGYAPSLFSVAQAADYTLTDNYTRGNQTVTMQPALYQDGDDYFYVVNLNENIHHFFIGFLGDMSAPVVAVSKLSKDNDGGGSGGGSGGGGDPPQIIFDANEGTFGNSTTSTQVLTKTLEKIKEDEDTVSLSPDEGTPKRDGYTFIGWNTKDDGSGVTYSENQPLSADDFEALLTNHGNGKSVRLYAMWEEKTLPNEFKEQIPDLNEYVKVGLERRTAGGLSFGDRRDIGYPSGKNNPQTEVWEVEGLLLQFKNINDDGTWKPGSRGTKYITFTYAHKKSDTRQGDTNTQNHFYLKIDNTLTTKTDNIGGKNLIESLVINFNGGADNTDSTKYRPLIFYYVQGKDDTAETHKANAPITLNLNTNFRGVIYAPDDDVTINFKKDNINFMGFIVAKNITVTGTPGSGTHFDTCDMEFSEDVIPKEESELYNRPFYDLTKLSQTG